MNQRSEFRNRCSLTQSCYLEVLLNLDVHLSSSLLRGVLRESVSSLLKRGDEVTIGKEDLTRTLTRVIVRLSDSSLLFQHFLFVEQTETELIFVETLLHETSSFTSLENNLRQWLVDLLLTMDLFNEQLFARVILFSFLSSLSVRRSSFSPASSSSK